MNRHLTAITIFVLCSAAWAAQAGPAGLGDCPTGTACPDILDEETIPDLITGHTVFAGRVVAQGVNHSTTFPTAGDSPSEPQPAPDPWRDPRRDLDYWDLAQAECVGWFNGKSLDVRPDPDPSFYGGAGDWNHHFGDEDEPHRGENDILGIGGGDHARQDYDPDRKVESCMPQIRYDWNWRGRGHPTDFAGISGFGTVADQQSPDDLRYAVVVEQGDCDPREGQNFRFRGHLDFVDPNDFYHEVQEYDYECGGSMTPTLGKTLFPWTYTGDNRTDACDRYEQPLDGNGHFDWGHKCNGSVQDLFTERLWITPIHETLVDPTLGSEYNFALVVDTCSGLNINEMGFFGGLEPHDVDAIDHPLDSKGLGVPLVEVCHDGSSWSFDDSARGHAVHEKEPKQIMEVATGNAFDVDANSTTFLMHRQNCRSNYIGWEFNDHPGRNQAVAGPAGVFEEVTGERPPRTSIDSGCYTEDHKNATVDVYVLDGDVTGGLFARHANGYTGLNTFVEGPVSDGDYFPPMQPQP